MPAVTAYTRLKNFTQYALDHTSAPYNASDHDAELDAIQQTIAALRTNLSLIQRADGALKNAAVHPDSLSTATKALIAGTWTPRGLWLTLTAYVVGDVVQNGTTSYVCASAHTSGVFATNYAAGKWIILGETQGAGAAAISFSPAGSIAATNVQAAIEELDAEKAPVAGGAGQTFLVADATSVSHATSMGQIQKGTLVSAVGTGTGDAVLATIASGLTTLTDGMLVIVEAPGSNTVVAPTFNLTLGATATGAKTIVKGNSLPLVAGDIASHKCIFVYDLSLDKWILANPAYAFGISTQTFDADSVKNLGLSFAVAANALTATVVTASGGTPTASDQIQVSMRSSAAATGTYNARTISSTRTLTISSGSTLGHSNGVASKIHWYLIDNAGTLELAASTKFFGNSGIVSTTAEGGAGAADVATTMYSTSARAAVPFTWIGETTDTQAAAGTWSTLPTAVSVARDFLPVSGGTVSGATTFSGVVTLSAQPIASTLTASLPVFSDGSKGLVSNAMTGSGSVVMSVSPTLTGTVGLAAAIATGTVTGAALIPSGASVPTNGVYLPGPNSVGISTNSILGLQVNSSQQTIALAGLFFDEAAGQTVFNYGREGSFATTNTGPFASTAGTCYFTRIGNKVTLTFATVRVAGNSVGAAINIAGLPAYLFPVTQTYTTVALSTNSGSDQTAPAMVGISIAGAITVWKNIATAGFDGTASTVGYYGFSVTYEIA